MASGLLKTVLSFDNGFQTPYYFWMGTTASCSFLMIAFTSQGEMLGGPEEGHSTYKGRKERRRKMPSTWRDSNP